jgi:hypothetical protein
LETIIDRRTRTRTFGVWPARVTVTVTIRLAQTTPGELAAYYAAHYRGIRNGRAFGGPLRIAGNGSWVVQRDPPVTVEVSDYRSDPEGRRLSGHLRIRVDAPVLGPITIFDETIGGSYAADAGDLQPAGSAES